MAVSERVIVELEARLDRYEANVARAERKFGSSMSAIQRSANATEGLVSRAMSGITGALAGVSAIALAQTFLGIADSAKTLEAQLRLATSGFGTFAQAQDDVRRIAAETRSGLEETASLYGNFARASKDLGASQAETARATETFSKTLKISGADANSAASATLQFGQALAAGALRGDELNSILEASPRLARLLAESFGMPIGKIKELGEEGKLTSDKLLNALTNTKFTEGVDREFRELPVTFQDAMTQVENAAIITFGAFDRGGQFSTALANFITQGSDGFEQLEQDALDFGIEVRSVLEGLSNAFDPLIEAARSAFGQIGDDAKSLSDRIRPLLGEIDSITGGLANSESGFEQRINKFLYGQRSSGTNLLGRFNQSQSEAETRLRRQNGQTPVSRILGKLSQGAKDAAQPPTLRSTPGGTSGSGGRSAANKAAAEARKAEQERLRDIRDTASKAREEAQIQDDINAAKEALAVATDDILRFNLGRIDSEKQQRLAQYETDRALGRITDKELADRTTAVNEIADLQRQRVQRIADENKRRDALDVSQAGLQNEQDLLRAQSDLTASRKERREIELRILDLTYQQEKAELDAVLASTASTQAQKDIAAARLRILDQLKSGDAERINRDNEGPLARYTRNLQERDTNDEVESYVVDELNMVRDSISGAIQKRLGVKDPLIAGLLNMFIEDVIMKPLAEALKGAGAGGTGGIFSAIGSALGGLFGGGRAIGGPVKAGVPYLVGENGGPRGKELFVPQQNGVIVPNHRLTGRSGGTTVISSPRFDLTGAVLTPELYADMQRISDESATRAAGASFVQSQQAAPGTLNKYNQLRG